MKYQVADLVIVNRDFCGFSIKKGDLGIIMVCASAIDLDGGACHTVRFLKDQTELLVYECEIEKADTVYNTETSA